MKLAEGNTAGYSASERNGNLDALRFIAAIGVISVHVGSYPELADYLGNTIRSMFRWCVPFFFIMTGYFLSDGTSLVPKVSIERVSVPLRAFVFASAAFFPVLLITSGPDGVTLETLIRGTHFHLWYLTSLIIALLVCHAFSDIGSRTWLQTTAVILVIAYVGISYFYALSGRRYDLVIVLRELLGIPCLLLGGWLRCLDRDQYKISLALLCGGIILSIVEVLVIFKGAGDPGEAQLLFGTLPIALGVLGVAVSTRDIAPIWLASLGRSESLSIYLYHPAAVLLVASFLAADVRAQASYPPGLVLWLLSGTITVAVLLLVRLWLPRLRKLLDGGR